MRIRNRMAWLGAVAIMGAAASVSPAQPATDAPAKEEQGEARGRAGRGGGFGERFGRGGGFGGDREAMMERMRQMREGGGFLGFGMRGGPGGGAQLAVVATDKYLFIVRGETVYQLDVDTLEVLKQIDLPRPQRQVVGENRDLVNRNRERRERPAAEADREKAEG